MWVAVHVIDNVVAECILFFFGSWVIFSGVNLGRDINFCSKQGTSLGDTSSKDSSGSLCATVNFFARVSISDLMKISCTVVGEWVVCSSWLF